MKIGFVLECCKGGPDEQVYTYLAEYFCPALEIEPPSTHINKKLLLEEFPETVVSLLESSGCDMVFVIWDLMPPWGAKKLSCKDDVKKFKQKIQKFGIDETKVILVCIIDMLESWLIADGRALTTYLSELHPTHKVKVPDRKTLSQQRKPKDVIWKYYPGYNDMEDAIKIVKLFPNFDRIARRNKPFNRFKKKIEELCPS